MAADPPVLGRQIHHGLAEGIGKAGGLLPQALAGGRIELSNAVEPGRVFLGRGIAAALPGDHMDQHRLAHFLLEKETITGEEFMDLLHKSE